MPRTPSSALPPCRLRIAECWRGLRGPSPLAVVATLVLVSTAAAAGQVGTARTFVSTLFGISADELRRVDAGEVVSRTLVADARDVATLGIVRMAVTPEFYVERLTDIADFKRTDAVLEIGTFSSPPNVGDVAALTLDDSDIRQLRHCRVGDCGVQLPA